MNFSLHYSIKYFKNNNCFPSIFLNLFFFLLMCLFWKNFQRNVQHSIHMSVITKRNSNVHFIFGNTGHAWHELTVKVQNFDRNNLTNGSLIAANSYSTRYKIHHAGEQATHWDIQNKENSSLTGRSHFVLDASCSAQLALQHGRFCTMWPLAAKGPLLLKN